MSRKSINLEIIRDQINSVIVQQSFIGGKLATLLEIIFIIKSRISENEEFVEVFEDEFGNISYGENEIINPDYNLNEFYIKRLEKLKENILSIYYMTENISKKRKQSVSRVLF